MKLGTKLRTSCPIQLSEDQEWPEGIEVEIVQVYDRDDYDRLVSYEIQAADGSIGSFAEIDLTGEFAWFIEA